MTKIVVLGGSFGGMTSAFELKRKLKDKARVVVISRDKNFVYIPSLIWVPFGRRTVDDITFSAEDTIRNGDIEFIHDEALRVVGEESKIVLKSGREESYDFLIVATGVAQARWLGYSRRKKAGESPALPDLSPLIKADMVKEGAVVIDVAINRIPKGFDEDGNPVKNQKGKNAMVTVGDVDFEAAKEKVAAITPVPGGVGPVTVAMLLANTIACAKAQA